MDVLRQILTEKQVHANRNIVLIGRSTVMRKNFKHERLVKQLRHGHDCDGAQRDE
jgi:hypothetical protein